MAENKDFFLPESSNPNERQLYDRLALNKRKTAVLQVLGSPTLKDSDEIGALKRLWVDELSEDLNGAIDRNEKRWGHPYALCISYADAALHYPPDAEFTQQFLSAFGARIVLDDEIIQVDPSNETIQRVLSSEVGLPRLPTSYGIGDLLDVIPEGSFVVTDQQGIEDYLVVDTDVEGVKLVLEGSAIRKPDSNWRMLRPMLLIKMADEKFVPLGEELPPDPRRQWSELHKREPGIRGRHVDFGKKNADKAIREGEVDMALAVSAWLPSARSGHEIMVTPTTLRDQPVVQSESEQLVLIQNAYIQAMEHFVDANSGHTEPVVGHTMWQLHILNSVLGMTAQEIMRDGEAMGTLVEYLEEVARARPGIYAPSSLLPQAKEGNEIAEMVSLIKDTWEFPDQSGISSTMLDDRVNWKRRASSNTTNN